MRNYTLFIVILSMTWTSSFSQILIDLQTIANEYIPTEFSISGQIIDETTEEPVMFASVALYKDGIVVCGAETDLDGRYVLKNIERGTYDIEPTFIGYEVKRVTGINVHKNIQDLNIQIKDGPGIECICYCGVWTYSKPLIKIDDTTSGMIITAEDIRPTYALSYSRPTRHKEKRKKKIKRNKKEISDKEQKFPKSEILKEQKVNLEQKTIEIHLYPNPTSGYVYFRTPTKISKVEVVNLKGQLLYSISDTIDGIDLTNLLGGTYFLKFHHQDGIQIEKLIVL